uniref:Uncharacterized protein n=1 Tax=Ditylenchus dipsaci TaxID=166011 RepID=A0A915D8C3_9BILA
MMHQQAQMQQQQQMMMNSHNSSKTQLSNNNSSEKYRTCLEYIHIVEAAKLILLLDAIKLTLETVYFTSKIGLCLPLAFLSLKITECVFCLLCMLIILILIILDATGHSFNLLKLLILWKYRRVEEEDAKSFALLLFLLNALLLVFNTAVFDLFFRTQRYFRKKAMSVYLRDRNEIMKIWFKNAVFFNRYFTETESQMH